MIHYLRVTLPRPTNIAGSKLLVEYQKEIQRLLKEFQEYDSRIFLAGHSDIRNCHTDIVRALYEVPSGEVLTCLAMVYGGRTNYEFLDR